MNTRIAEMEKEIARLREQVTKLEEEKADLDSRLKAVFQLDEIDRTQKLQTLKRNLAESLCTHFNGCFDPEAYEFSKDNFEANRATLKNIYKVLKRYGIELN